MKHYDYRLLDALKFAYPNHNWKEARKADTWRGGKSEAVLKLAITSALGLVSGDVIKEHAHEVLPHGMRFDFYVPKYLIILFLLCM